MEDDAADRLCETVNEMLEICEPVDVLAVLESLVIAMAEHHGLSTPLIEDERLPGEEMATHETEQREYA